MEVISGVPSAEYGDLGSGMVRIRTKRGKSPLSVTFSVNPRTYQASLSKGIDLGAKAGILNLSAEWANATKKLTSPYESYTRRGIGAVWSNNFDGGLRFELGLNGNIGGMDSKDGAENMSILAMSDGYDAANYPAINKCAATSPWYMPSLGELKNAFGQIDAIQAALQSIGLDEIKTDRAYATSNEVSGQATTIYGVTFTESEELEGILDISTVSLNKADKSLVRAIREF